MRPGDDTLSDAARLLSSQLGPLRRTVLRASRNRGNLPDLPEAQIEVLRALSPAQWSGPSQLAQALGMARPTVSNLLAGMERSGLVQRRLVAGDGRRTEITLTELARTYLRVYDDSARQVVLDALTELDPKSRRALVNALPALDALRDLIDKGQLPDRS